MLRYITLVALPLAFVASSAMAASHAHMRHLEKAHCTQVQEAEGNCPALQAHPRVQAKVIRTPHALVDGIELRCDMPLPVDVTNAGRKWVDTHCD